jgi:hypothetical protein
MNIEEIRKYILGDILYNEASLKVLSDEELLERYTELNLPVDIIKFLCKFKTLDSPDSSTS